ncbi:putative transcription factor interactor and regulator CCHC(Zn) family [Helianthus annuus]|uniref:Transcription factor interactor and regulator CCHC(Zn) family n=1 Tax=Helianthus annuus TaxID=4232 RepID=A0A9K3IXW0_HELAN|nr:putative transcription factor interactor and regulator CCHC(Zn) family [Helianthus annuus]KAJ0569607.1 putative transcription factor interactor and regulator CCHC(Zn) family [Helianthus annuus]KAJ0583917.1 putative transcription factor interactor and regulator CCHC(Zn) family [Helianthus annuus]KAJ0921942.1 putative transcription factor interactor and regulator CCHC(Zn) family [Helianthus annuus]
MSASFILTSAASAYSYAQDKNDPDVQHSGIRATPRLNDEIKPTATCMPCQHCTDEKNEKKRRVSRERLCYYCHMPGHQIYTCKAKENDEEMQLIKQAINAGIRSQNDDVHCREEMIVTGTDGGQWNEIWYVNPTFNHHFVGNIDVFKRVKHIMGVETRSGMNNFLFIRGVGHVEVKTGNEKLQIPSVFYSPDIDRNVLSLEQLTLQGFTVRRFGDTCKIFPMFSSHLRW